LLEEERESRLFDELHQIRTELHALREDFAKRGIKEESESRVNQENVEERLQQIQDRIERERLSGNKSELDPLPIFLQSMQDSIELLQPFVNAITEVILTEPMSVDLALRCMAKRAQPAKRSLVFTYLLRLLFGSLDANLQLIPFRNGLVHKHGAHGI
jgi:hypothetical protein